MARPDVGVMREPMTPARLADALEKAIADPDTTADMFGEYARWNLPTILAALRSTGTGRSDAEAEETELPAGEPITEEASEAALIVAQEIEEAIQVRGIFSYAPDGRPCLTWYGEQRIAKVIDAHLEEVPEPALNPPEREGEGDHV